MAVEYIKKTIGRAVKTLKLAIDEGDIGLEHPAVEKFGDWSTNVAMVLGKKYNKNPNELAKKIKYELDKIIDKTELVGEVEVIGGYINFHLKTAYLIKEAEKINYEIELKNELNKVGGGKTMVIDYSAPNIAKPFGIGHLRSTNIGQAIYNIYKSLGWKCIGDNHLGDWGTQFGKLIVAIKKWGEKPIEKMTIEDLEKLYVKFHEAAENEPGLEDEARDWFAKLENKDGEARDIWQKCIDISLLEFDKVYGLLGVKIDYALGESFYEDALTAVTQEIVKKGITRESQGATIIEFDDKSVAIIKKSNETSTYFTRDMATIKYRIEKWKPDLIVYEVGADQSLHFRQLFKAAEMMGWTDSNKMIHVAHGLIRWKDGKFSTRKGSTIHLAEVVEKAMEKARKIAPKNDEEIIRAVAVGAIKFNDLSGDPKKDIIFDWDKVMNLEGDSGPYLQYTLARSLSVLQKTKVKEQKNVEYLPDKFEPEEVLLLRELTRLGEKIEEAARRFNPAVLAQYLLTVAQKYNEFYGKLRIIDQKEEVFRVFLTKTTVTVLKLGLKLLGIPIVEKM